MSLIVTNPPVPPSPVGLYDSASIQFLPYGTGAIAESVSDELNSFWVRPEQFLAAAGDGVTDASTAMTRAVATTRSVRGTPGATYLLDAAITVSTAGQVLDFRGCNIKLKNSATNKGIFTLTGAKSKVFGGTWDMNKANNGTGDQYGHYAVSLAADGCVAQFMYVKNSKGLGIKGIAGANNISVAFNQVEGCELHSIYVESTSADAVGNKICWNQVDASSMGDGGSGIYLTGKSDMSFLQRRWDVSHNVVKGPTPGTGTTIGITVRGYEGIYAFNQVTGCLIQHSIDHAQRCVITGNRGTDPDTGTSYGLEINGVYNTVTANYMKGQAYGVISSGQIADGNTFAANTLEAITSRGFYIAPGGSNTSRNCVYEANNITFSTGASRVGYYIAGDAQGSTINGGRITGPGSGQSGGRAVFLDTPAAAAKFKISGVKVSGMERAWSVYSNGALTVTDLADLGNDLADDVAQSDTGWFAEGSAVFGARVQHAWGFDVNGGTTYVIDKLNNVFILYSTSYNSPEGLLTAGPGSLYYSTNSTGGGWFKDSGTGNTGWKPIRGYDYNGSATYDPASLNDGVGATTTVTATGAVLGDFAEASFSLDLQGITLTAYVSTTNTVAVRFQNESGGTLDLGSGTLRVRVKKA